MQELLIRIGALRAKLDEAWRVLGLEAAKERIQKLESQSSAPEVWDDPAKAKVLLQSLNVEKKRFEAWNALRMQLLELEELARFAEQEHDHEFQKEAEEMMEVLEKRYFTQEFDLLFSGAHDAKSAIVAIHAGAGGTDAQDWAEMLLRMYVRYGETKEWNVRLLDESRGGEAGIKSVTFLVEGDHVYGHLKSEAGVHRLVRQSPFNADALRQTSFALVEVLPELEDDVDVDIKPDDLRIDTFMSGGKGGQSVNTTYSAVRIVHLPTKITVSCQNERSQTQNKATAMKILRAKLLALKEGEQQKEKQELRGEFQSAEWGNQIRSYVLHPYKMVKDHRTNVETSQAEEVLEGNLDAFIEGYLRYAAEKEHAR